jgi:LysM repeat protein
VKLVSFAALSLRHPYGNGMMSPLMTRRAAWAGILAVLLALVVTAAAWGAPPSPVVTTPTPQPTPTPKPLTPHERLTQFRSSGQPGALVFLPFAAQASQLDTRPDSFGYTVQPGDTLWSLALDFGRDLDTMSCATTPTGADAEALTPGQTITVPALTDLCYTVRPGDSLRGIAARHKLSVDQIAAVPWNGLVYPPYHVRPKQRILLPGARPDAKPRGDRQEVSRPSDQWGDTPYQDWPYGDGKFIWPVEGGWLSQGAHLGHTALDIAVPLGTNIVAADRGKVISAGWNPTGYGFRVVINHGIDYITLYAHLSDIYVQPGDIVGKGQVIGLSGANGNITGPHLHFEVRDFGRLIDPLKVLP